MATDSLTLEDLPSGSPYLSSTEVGQTRTRAEWEALAGEAVDAYVCDACNSAFEACPDGNLEWIAREGEPDLVPREHRGVCRTRAEWARIAKRLPAGVPDVRCPSCEARFDETAPGALRLLDAARDPHGLAAQRRGETHRAAIWGVLAAGRREPTGPGEACPACTAYLQKTGRDQTLALVSFDPATDPFGAGRRYDGRELRAQDWQRVAAGGLPEAEEQRLREEARSAFWQGMLAGEISTSAAERSLPVRLAPGEKAVITFPAVMVRSRFGFFYEEVHGDIWLTTRQVIFRGNGASLAVPLASADGSGIVDMGQGYPLVEVDGPDGAPVLRFYMGSGQMEFTIDGLRVPVQWDEHAFVNLFESLRRRA